jgi:hypothetical protein
MSFETVITVFTASVLELWLAIPLGLALGLNPVLTALASMAGSIFAVLMVILAGDNLRTHFIRWKYGDEKQVHRSRLNQIWNQYGVVGLGLLSPLILGAPLGSVVGIALGAEKRLLMIWMSLGIIVWSFGLTWAGFMGMINLQNFIH